MPGPELDLMGRAQKIVLWRKIGQDRYNETIYQTPPTELVVRWMDTQREVMRPDGTTIMIEAEIGLGAEDVAPGDLVWQGGITDIPGTGMQPTDGVMQVFSYNKSPDVNGGRYSYRKAKLMRYRATLPVANS